MLNSNIIQNSLSSLHSSAVEADKIKKEGIRNQEATQKKFDEIVSKQITSVNATDQDSDPQKILDEEENKEQEKEFSNRKKHHSKAEIVKDTNKGTVVDIKC